MVSIDYSVFFQVANFLVLIFVLNYVLYGPIREGLKKRKEKFTGLARGTEADQKEAAQQREALSASLLEARSEGAAKKEALVAEAAEQEKDIIGEINDKAAKDLDALRAKIAGEVSQAESALAKEVDSFASAIGEKVLGRAMS